MGRVKGGLGHPDHQSDPPPAPRPNPPPPAGTCQLPGGGGEKALLRHGRRHGCARGRLGGGACSGQTSRVAAAGCALPVEGLGTPPARRRAKRQAVDVITPQGPGHGSGGRTGGLGGGGLEEEVGGWWWRWCCTEGSSGGGWCPLYATWVSGCRPVWPCRLIDCRLRHTIGWLKWRRAAATRAPSNSGCTICRCIGLSATMTEPERRWNCRGSGPAPTRPPRVCGM